MTKGTYLATSCSANDTTLYVGDTTDFPAPGGAQTAWIIDSANDRDAFTYTGKTATTLTGVPSSGANAVLAHTVSAANKPLVVPAVKGMYINDAVNEMRFFGDRGDGTIEEMISCGVRDPIGSGNAYCVIGSANSTEYSSLQVLGKGTVGLRIDHTASSYDSYAISTASTNGYGAVFQSGSPTGTGHSPLRIVPNTGTTGVPASSPYPGSFYAGLGNLWFMDTGNNWKSFLFSGDSASLTSLKLTGLSSTQISAGANDSAGSGYRLLRIPNA